MKRTSAVGAVFAALLFSGCFPVAATAGTYSENFESGYVAGPLGGQNGWETWTEAGLDVTLTGGFGGSVGLVDPGPGEHGTKILHGLDLTNATKVNVSGKVFVGGGFAQFDLRDAANNKTLAFEVFNRETLKGFRIEAVGAQYVSDALFDQPVTADWYTLELDWTFGGNAVYTAKDPSNAIVATLTVDTSAVFGDPTEMTYIDVYGNDATSEGTLRMFDDLFATDNLATAYPGDFDGDGDVDGADFVVWQTHFPTASGATLADGDADGDGDVDGADFVVWQTNFPFTPSPGVAPVPEPTALILALLGGVAVLAHRAAGGRDRRTLR